MATTENSIFLNPAELATEIRAVMEADTALRREELAKRIANKMIAAAQAPAPKPEAITRFAGLSHDMTSRSNIDDAIFRRLAQIKAIGALLGTVDSTFHDVPDQTFSNASWALQDLTAEAEELVMIYSRMTRENAQN
jgi:hypothetical protein